MEKNNPVIIFGLNDNAQLAKFYLTEDSDFSVAGFCVDEKYLPERPEFMGLPIYSFEQIDQSCPPDSFDFFAPLAPAKMNTVREEKFKLIKNKGYHCISYISSRATNFSEKIGENCFILEDNTIQPYTEIGDNVILWSGNHIGHHGKIGDHVMFTSHVVMSGHCDIGNNSFLGVNSTLTNAILLGEGTLVSLGSVIEGDTEPWSVYKGNPAIKLGIPSKRIRL